MKHYIPIIILIYFIVSLLFTSRFWLTWGQTTSVLKMKMEHWSVSSANSPNRHGERDMKSRDPPPPSTHSSQCQRARERGKRRWTPQLDLDCDASLWTAGMAFVCLDETRRHVGLWLWTEAPTVANMRLDSSQNVHGWCNTQNTTCTMTVHQGNTKMHTHSYACIEYFLHAHSTERIRQLWP